MIRAARLHLILLAFCAVAWSCNKKFELATFSPRFLLPLAHGDLNINQYDFGDKAQISGIDTLYINYADTILTLGLEDIVGLPDTTVTSEFIVPFSGITFPPGVPFYSEVKNTTYKMGSVQLKRTELKAGKLKLKLQNTIDKPVLFTYIIHSATLDGDTFRVNEVIAANSAFTKTYSLSGYELNLRGVDGNLFNTISGQFAVMIDPNETQGHTLILGDKFTAQFTFSDIVPQAVFGYFGSQSSMVQDSVNLDVFNRFPFDSLNIEQFNVGLFVDNGIGADLSLNINSIEASNSISSKHASLEAPFLQTDLKLNRAVDLNAGSVKHQQRFYQLNQANSNLDRMVEVAPNRLDFDVEIFTNPYGNISLGNDFAYYNHPLSLILNAHMPLAFGLGRLHLVDTLDFKFQLSEEQDSAMHYFGGAVLKVELTNGFELESEVQVYFLDSNLVTIDSLFENRVSIAGSELINGTREKVISEFKVRTAVHEIDSLQMASHIKVDAFLSTKNQQVANLKGDGKISFRMAAEIGVFLP